MPRRHATFAAVVLSLAFPALAQQPVYPSFPPPPAPTADNAPHPQAPDTQDDGQQPYPQPANPQPTNPLPDPESTDRQSDPQPKPSPYPPADDPNPQPDPQAGPPQQTAPPYPSAGGSSLSWVPRGVEALGRTAAFHTDFTFDRAMLQLASGFWEGPTDPATAAAISRLDGISVHSYHYAAPGMYDPRLLDGVRRQYAALGWQHLVTARTASTDGATDLWISFHHLQATGAVVLFAGPTNLNLIAFSGNLSPLDLLHLRGHFGIPRFPGDRFAPPPGPAARVVPPTQPY